jgi:photosystem II stability/assembly factor-like uncharacterized protein
MKIKIGKKLKQNCSNGTNNLIQIILLSIILCGQSYAQWEKTNFPDTVKVNTIVTKDSYIFVGTDGDGIFVSTNNGENWKSMNEGLQSKLIHTILITGKTLPAGQTRIFAGTETGVSVSTDNGENWRSINSGLSGLGVWSLEVSEDTLGDTTIFAGAWSGVYSSTDWGENWEVTSLSNTTAPVNSILIYKNFICAATFSEGIFNSYDNGLTWKNIDVKTKASFEEDFIPKSAPIYSIKLFAGPEANTIIVGSIGGLYHTFWGDTIFYDDTSFAKIYKQDAPVLCFANRNDTLFTAIGGYLFKLYWVHIYFRGYYGNIIDSIAVYDAERLYKFYLGIPVVYSLALNDAYIFAGTEDGIWGLRYPETITGVENSQEVPTGFVLEQNYPNPFNPTTVVSYRLPVASNVTLIVYDLLGRPVATLVNERQIAGHHSVKFDAGGLPSGVYFYRLHAGSFVHTKKLILLQ